MSDSSATPASITRELLKMLWGEDTSDFHVRLWDGTYWPDDAPRPATLVLNHPGALRAMFLPGNEVTMGEAYLYDDFDVEGSLELMFAASDRLVTNPPSLSQRLRLLAKLLRLPNDSRRVTALRQLAADARGRSTVNGTLHSLERDRQAVIYHYDISNDFYALWQDPLMLYTCAYFQSPDEDLDPAQVRKLDYTCRKLRLKPGQKLLDIGCGWGGLVIYAAKKYGVDVTGITLSQPQADLANARIQAEGLGARCRVQVCDYRQMEEHAAYDALVSVGMFEQVGRDLLPTYFARAWDLLKPGGVFLNHGIALGSSVSIMPGGRTFLNTYVFPDGELVHIHTTLRAAEKAGFEVRDVESLRDHYAPTLRQWVHRLEVHHEQVLQYVSEPSYRVWRLFMSGAALFFATGRSSIYQALLLKTVLGGASGLPLSREDWYRE
jgi:cyclopropane-fatty-acyl-phospholipid synthase